MKLEMLVRNIMNLKLTKKEMFKLLKSNGNWKIIIMVILKLLFLYI